MGYSSFFTDHKVPGGQSQYIENILADAEAARDAAQAAQTAAETAQASTEAYLNAAASASVFIRVPIASQVYALIAKSPLDYRVDALRGLKVASGSATVTAAIDGVPITGLEELEVSETSQDFLASGLNTLSEGSRLTLTVDTAASAADLEFTLKFTRT